MEEKEIEKTVKKVEKSIDAKKANEVLSLTKRILHVVYILLIFAIVYIGVLLLRHFNVFDIVFKILGIISPLFIGFFIAWLFNPLVKTLKKKKIKRGLATSLIYVLLIGLIVLLISSIIPILSREITNVVNLIPSIVTDVKDWLTNIIERISSVDGIDTTDFKTNVFGTIEEYATNITTSLPDTFINIVQPFLSGAWSVILGLIIGFYLLIGFENVEDTMLSWFPKKIQSDFVRLFGELNKTLRSFLKGAFWDAMVVFVATSIGFWIIGLESPILFGLFCGITNVIPYAGPYIGGAPAVLVGFSGGLLRGILTLVIVAVVQMLEGNLLQPLIMSKTTKLHPVTIILGLLIFGYFFGIVGMLISTPTISCLKTIYKFLDEKYDFLSYTK